VVKTSEEAAMNFDLPIEFIFVDGAHAYDLVKLDFDLWFPKVIDGGIMAFHDTAYAWETNPDPASTGPQRVVDEFVYKSTNFKNINLVDSITVAQKVGKNTFLDRLGNRYIFARKYLYEKDIKNKWQRIIFEIPKNIMRKLFKWFR
jgi:hypothetical protein